MESEYTFRSAKKVLLIKSNLVIDLPIVWLCHCYHPHMHKHNYSYRKFAPTLIFYSVQKDDKHIFLIITSPNCGNRLVP